MSEPELSDDELRQLLSERIKKASRRVAMVAFVCGEPSSPSELTIMARHRSFSYLWQVHCDEPSRLEHVPRLAGKRFHIQAGLDGQGFAQPVDLSDAQLISEDRDLDLSVLSYHPSGLKVSEKSIAA